VQANGPSAGLQGGSAAAPCSDRHVGKVTLPKNWLVRANKLSIILSSEDRRDRESTAMELAHRPAGVFRVIGKVLFLGLLIILVAKAFLILLALAAGALLVFFCGRRLSIRRVSWRRILLTTKRMVRPGTTAVGVGAMMLATAGGWICLCVSW